MAGGGEMMETEPTSLNNNDNNKTVERKQQGCLKIRQQQQKPGDRLLPILPKPAASHSLTQQRRQSGPLFIREPVVRESPSTTTSRRLLRTPRSSSAASNSSGSIGVHSTSTPTMNYFGHLFFEAADWSPLYGTATEPQPPQQQQLPPPKRFTFDQTSLPSTSVACFNSFTSPTSTSALMTPHFADGSAAAEKFLFSPQPLPAATSFFFPLTTPSASRISDGMCEAFLPPPPSALAAVFPPSPVQGFAPLTLAAQPSTSIGSISMFHFSSKNNNTVNQSPSDVSQWSADARPQHTSSVLPRGRPSFRDQNVKQEKCSAASWVEPTSSTGTEGISSATTSALPQALCLHVKVEEPEVVMPEVTTAPLITAVTSSTADVAATAHPLTSFATNSPASTSIASSTSSSSSSTIVPISAASLICDRFSPSSISCASIDSGCFCESSFPPSSPDSTSCSSTSSSGCGRVGSATAVNMVAALMKSTALQSASSHTDLTLHRPAAAASTLIAWLTTKVVTAAASASATVRMPPNCQTEEAVTTKRQVQSVKPMPLAYDDEDDIPLPKISKLEPIDVDLGADDLEMPKLEREEPIPVVSLSDFLQGVANVHPVAEKLSSTSKGVLAEDLCSAAENVVKEAPSEDAPSKEFERREKKAEAETAVATTPQSSICGCFWASCERNFPDDNQLYDHVVEAHLEKVRPTESSTSAATSTSRKTRSASRRSSNQGACAAGNIVDGGNASSLACQWDGCTMSLQRGSAQKQFDWLMNHFTTRHAPRAQPFSCLFADCPLRFRTRQTLSDHLRCQHDDLRGRSNRTGSGATGSEPLKCFGFQPNVQILPNLDMMDRRTCIWIQHVLLEKEKFFILKQQQHEEEEEEQQKQQRLLSTTSRKPLADRGSTMASPPPTTRKRRAADLQKMTLVKSADVDENRCDDNAMAGAAEKEEKVPPVVKRLEVSKTRALLRRLFKTSDGGAMMRSPVRGVAKSARRVTTHTTHNSQQHRGHAVVRRAA